MKKFPGGKIALVLLALMAVSFVLLVFAKDEKSTNPTIESTYPSGLAAFAELLRRDGYQVKLDKRPRPKLEKGDLVLSIDVDRFQPEFKRDGHVEKARETIAEFVDGGGSELSLALPSDYEAASITTALRDTRPLEGLPAKSISISNGAAGTAVPATPQTITSTSATATWQEGPHIEVHEAIGVTNRYLAQGDNAEVFLSYVHMLAPKGSRVVFPEALIDNVENPGPLETLGPWAVAGKTQTYLLVLVVVSTLAVRFGSPHKGQIRQRSARDMVDAVSELLRRGGKAQFALETALEDTYERFRLGVSAPLGTSRAHLKERMPEALLAAVSKAENFATGAVTDDSWAGRSKVLPLARELDLQASAFEQDTRQRRLPTA